ncbi:MAG: hypothetical protein C4523_01665 [Myxococcales bacterium]|nr:MAG: hypothetical protein C4523_01665 [Myxococcales bacterium]
MMTTALIHYAILAPLIWLGTVSSLDDWRFGKIYRQRIVFGLAVGAAWYASLAALHAGFLGDGPAFAGLLGRAALTGLAALAIAFGMWWADVWSGGDAKLYAVFALLLPLPMYERFPSPLAAALVLLINSYAVAFIVISADFLVRFARRAAAAAKAWPQAEADARAGRRQEIRDYLRANAPTWIKGFFGFWLAMILMRLARTHTQAGLEGVVHWDDTTAFLVLFLAFRPLHRLFQRRVVFVLVGAGLAAYLIYLFRSDPGGRAFAEAAAVGYWSLGLMAFRQVYSYWCSLVEVREVPLAELKAHTLVARTVVEEMAEAGKLSSEEKRQIGVEGLTEEFAIRIREHYASLGRERIKIDSTIPFAPFLFAGLVATTLLRDVMIRLNG